MCCQEQYDLLMCMQMVCSSADFCRLHSILLLHLFVLVCRLALCTSLRAQQIGSSQPLPPQSPTGSLRALSQRRAYMDSGWLAQDQAVIAYMKKLELHK